MSSYIKCHIKNYKILHHKSQEHRVKQSTRLSRWKRGAKGHYGDQVSIIPPKKWEPRVMNTSHTCRCQTAPWTEQCQAAQESYCVEWAGSVQSHIHHGASWLVGAVLGGRIPTCSVCQIHLPFQHSVCSDVPRRLPRIVNVTSGDGSDVRQIRSTMWTAKTGSATWDVVQLVPDRTMGNQGGLMRANSVGTPCRCMNAPKL